MSYDLCARGDARFSARVPRSRAADAVERVRHVVPNGSGFLFRRSDSTWMEIDLELVDEEGDVAGALGSERDEVSCISFHVPYAFVESLDACRAAALEVAGALGWELFDPQTEQVLTAEPGRRPWWRLW